jgi:hypothetical protein
MNSTEEERDCIRYAMEANRIRDRERQQQPPVGIEIDDTDIEEESTDGEN